jgi:protein involved in polysaccharide export with SLBB domain
VLLRRNPGFRVEQLVRVEGEVLYPGEYAISSSNERISDLLQRAGGFTRFAYPKGATLIRRNEYFQPPTEAEQRRQVLESIKKNLPLESLSRSELNKELEVRINKEIADKIQVANSDQFLIDKEKLKITESSFEKETTQLDKKPVDLLGIDLEEILRNPLGSEDLILLEAGVLSIPKELQTVRMRGEILNPTSTKYVNGKSFKYYVGRAGGFTLLAKRNKSYVIYPNGGIARTKSILIFSKFPRVQPGSELIIPPNDRERQINPLNLINSITGVVGSALTLYLLLTNLPNTTGN